jgi:hypothetical protein
MALILLSVLVAAILFAIPKIRNRIASEGCTRSGVVRKDSSITKEHVEQSRIAGSMKKFFVVVLPDGTIVNPRVADRV